MLLYGHDLFSQYLSGGQIIKQTRNNNLRPRDLKAGF